ncbi:MAG TPA: YfcC family protein, partial [Wenzhouxiangellaceae bacterium]|nr:YfcC family protein [Wenzhouxiangellaceae bacterium]
MTESQAGRKTSPFRIPHTLALMFIMMVVALVLTWILPAGEFETVVNESGREVVVPGTYETLEDAETLSPWSLFTAVPRAMADAQGIIFFVLIIGGALRVIR